MSFQIVYLSSAPHPVSPHFTFHSLIPSALSPPLLHLVMKEFRLGLTSRARPVQSREARDAGDAAGAVAETATAVFLGWVEAGAFLEPFPGVFVAAAVPVEVVLAGVGEGDEENDGDEG